MRMIDNDEVGLNKARRFLIDLFGTAHLEMRRVVTPRGRVVGDARHWHDQPFYAIPKQLQWQFLESLGEDMFVMQLGALHIKDRCPLMISNLMKTSRRTVRGGNQCDHGADTSSRHRQ